MKIYTRRLLCGGALSLLLAIAPLTAHAAKAEVAAPIAIDQVARNPLVGTQWRLTSPIYDGVKTKPVLLFTDNKLNASVGLNSIFGDYTVDARAINIDSLASTMMAGSKPLMDAEVSYAKALQGARGFKVAANGKSLTLHGDRTLTFELEIRAPQSNESTLAGTEWTLIAPTYVGLKNAPVLKFTDTTLNASVGLNSIFGAYKIDARKITIQPLASTKMAGPESVMQAENLYIKALQSVRSFGVYGNGKALTLYGDLMLTFRLTKSDSPGFVPTETKIINVAPQLGSAIDGDKSLHYLQLEDLSDGVSWGHFTEPKIIGFDFVPGYRYQLRVQVERDARTNEKRLRLLEVFSQQWMRTAELGVNDKILEVAPTKVHCVGVAPMKCLQVREAGGEWMNFYAPIEGFDFQEGWRYRLQVTVTEIKNPPADGSSLRYKLVRVLDKMPVTY